MVNGGAPTPAIRVCLLPGDGVGPEVTAAAVAVLEAVAPRLGLRFSFEPHDIGGVALRRGEPPLPAATLAAAQAARAVLFGAVGAAEFDNGPPERKPESGLIALRRALGCFANLRPLFRLPGADLSPVKPAVAEGADFVVVRELTGGLYYGEPRGIAADRSSAWNTMRYAVAEIERVAHVAFGLARERRHAVTSVEKANVLETGQLWREVVTRVGREYPDVALRHMYADNCALQLMLRPRDFDVIVAGNLFGDILSDEAGALAGSLGVLPSASIGGAVNLYEPVHGSAPDLAGKNIANPVGAILSGAMLLRYTFGAREAAEAVDRAVRQVLAAGTRPRDLGGSASTSEVTAAVVAALAS